MSNELGYIKGEQCNRNGCVGIIEEREKEGGCSCHINPPCSYCTTQTEYCPVCEWEVKDEPLPTISDANLAYYQKEQDRYTKQRESFYAMFRGQERADKLIIRQESHTHFSQILRGVFPEGTETEKSILPKVGGTFGGKFTRFNKTSFEYIAYTD